MIVGALIGIAAMLGVLVLYKLVSRKSRRDGLNGSGDGGGMVVAGDAGGHTDCGGGDGGGCD